MIINNFVIIKKFLKISLNLLVFYQKKDKIKKAKNNGV